MATLKSQSQNQGEYQMKKSSSASPNSVQSANESMNKSSQQIGIIKDSFGQDLAQRIKKAKDEIFVQNNQRKGKSGEKKNKQNIQMEEENFPYGSKGQDSEKRKGSKNANLSGVLQNEIKINIFQDENLNTQFQGNLQQFNQNKMKDEQENDQHSDFNSNQIECSESNNRDQDEEDDPFIDDLMLQKNHQFGNQFPIIGGGIDTQKFISIIFNKNEGTKDTINQSQEKQKQTKAKRGKEKKEGSSATKQNENGNQSARGKKNNVDASQIEGKPKREYKKRGKKSENSEQDAMKNQQANVSGEDLVLKPSTNQFNLNLQNSSLAPQNAISNSNSTTPKNNISKNIIIQNYANVNQAAQQNISNENYNSSNSHANQSSAAAAAAGLSSTKKGFRQYHKESKIPSNQTENSNQTQIIDQEGLINLFLQVQQGFQLDKGEDNLAQQNNALNATLEALLQGSATTNPISSTPKNTATSKRKQKSESKIKPFVEEGQSETLQKSNQKQKMLSTPAKNANLMFQEPSSVSCRLNMDIENLGSEQYEGGLITSQALQATATTAPSSSSKKQKIHNNNEYKEKSEEKPKKKLKILQDDLGDNSHQQTPLLSGLPSGKKSKKEKKQKEIIQEQQSFKNSHILNVTKTDNSLLVQLIETTEDPEQREIEKQIEEFSFTKEVKQKLTPEEKRAQEEHLKNSKVFNLLWEKQQFYKRKLELYQLSSFERYQQHKILELKSNIKSEQFYLVNQSPLENSNSDKKEDQGLVISVENNDSTKSEIQNQNICDQIKVNRELSFSGPNLSNSIVEEEDQIIQESNQENNKAKSQSAQKIDEAQIKQEDENPELKKSSKKGDKEDKDPRDFTQKFQDLKNKFLTLKQTFKPSIITA